jgi:Tfp pilus assembly protein PilO
MDKKSKILLIVLIALTAVSIGYTFYKTVIQQDFEIVNTEPVTE